MKKIFFAIIIALLHLTAFAQASDPDVIEFAFLTDTHKFGPSADIRYADANIIEFVKYCQNTPSLKFALFGGDFMNAYDTNHKQALFCLERGRNDFKGIGIPFYTTKGNHDCNGKQRTADGKKDGTQIVTDHEYFNLFSPLSPVNPLADSTDIVYDEANREGNYYYRDFPEQRFRMIVLNDYDRDSLEYFGYHGLQMKWLTEKALNFTDKADPEDWCFIMLGHYLSVNIHEHPINRIIHAYVNGQQLEDSDHGASYRGDFHLQKRAKMVAFLAGHQHEDMYQRTEDYNMITMTRGFATGGEVDTEPISFSHFTLNVREKTLLEHRIGRGRDRKFTYDPHDQIWPVPSFEGAEGLGYLTNGGKGGRIITVTNLNDSGKGSLRWAVEQEGCRMVLFNVAGTINLKSPLVIANDSISIIGQSAPGQGICLKGAPVKILASEVCLRYLHVRPGMSANGERVDAISDGDFGQHNIILDHLSVSFSTGHGIAIRRAQDVSVQYCIVSHSLENAGPLAIPEDGEPAGILAGGFMTTFYKNLIANCANAMMFPNEEGQNRWVHVMRNMFYNWRDHAMYGGGRQGEITLEDNYLIPGPATQNTQVLDVAEDGTGRYYVSWNTMKGRENLSGQNWRMVNDVPAMPYIPTEFDAEERAKMHPVQRPQQGDFGTTCITIAAFHYKPVWYGKTAMEPRAVYRDVMLQAGCSYNRDSYDTQLLDNIKNEKPFGSNNGLISQYSKAMSWPVIKSVSEKKPVLTTENVDKWIEDRVKIEKSIVILYESSAMKHLDMFPRLSGFRDAISADTAHVAMICSGDIVKTVGHEDANVIELLRHMEYDAIVPTQVDLSKPIIETFKKLEPVGHVVTTCSLLDKKHNYIFAQHIIKQYGNRKVAYVGISTPTDLPEQELKKQIQKSVNQARHSGADFVIAVANDNETLDSLSDITGIDATIENTPQSICKIIIANDGLVTKEIVPDNMMLFKNPTATHLYNAITSK